MAYKCLGASKGALGASKGVLDASKIIMLVCERRKIVQLLLLSLLTHFPLCLQKCPCTLSHIVMQMIDLSLERGGFYAGCKKKKKFFCVSLVFS